MEPISIEPNDSQDVITLTKQPDGNWIGRGYRFGKFVEVREIGPETALQALLTHP